jgi:hypothetical protein
MGPDGAGLSCPGSSVVAGRNSNTASCVIQDNERHGSNDQEHYRDQDGTAKELPALGKNGF